MAAPHVTGVAALLVGECGTDMPTTIDAILSGSDPVSGFASLTVTGGRLNARGAAEAAAWSRRRRGPRERRGPR